MGILSQFRNLKITAPETPTVSKSKTNDQDMWSSQSRCEIVEGSHVYKINGYSLAKGIQSGKHLTSCTFTVGGYDWVIHFHPNDYGSKKVYVYIVLVSDGPVRAFYESKLLDQSGKGKHSRLQKSGKTPTEFRKGYLCPLLLKKKKSDLETSRYLKDDCLSIHCRIGVLQTHAEEGKHIIHVPPSDMIQNLKGLLKSEYGFDVTFHVGDKFFRAHKWILATRSSVFRAQFFGLVGNPSMEIVPIKEFDPFAFQAMLLFLYSDELPETHELSDYDSLCTSTTIMQHLLVAADRFDLPRLKLMCEAKLSEEITVNTVATTLVLAELHQCPHLRTVCLNFIANPRNLSEVMKSDGYANLENSCPSTLTDLLKKTNAVIDNK